MKMTVSELAKVDPSIKKSLEGIRQIGRERLLGRDVLAGKYKLVEDDICRCLLDRIPSGGKYKITRKLAQVFRKYGGKAQNYLLAQRLPLGLSQRLTKKVYNNTFGEKKKEWEDKIKSRLKTLKRLSKPLGYTFSFHSEGQFSELVLLGR